MATEHEAVCRSIVDDQVEALSEALGPKAMELTYLAMLNAEGVFFRDAQSTVVGGGSRRVL